MVAIFYIGCLFLSSACAVSVSASGRVIVIALLSKVYASIKFYTMQ